MRVTPPGLLPEPVVTFDREGGYVVSAYLKLREGVKAAGCIQPKPDALVFFYVAADGIPIGIRFHEPASGVAVCELVDSLFEGLTEPDGAAREAPYHLFTKPREVQAFVKALREAIIGLEDRSNSSPVSG